MLRTVVHMIAGALVVAVALLSGQQRPDFPLEHLDLTVADLRFDFLTPKGPLRSSCSGVHVGGGLIVTAAHCTGANNSIRPEVGKGQPTQVLWADAQYDVALIYSRAMSDAPFVRIDCRPMSVGEEVEAITRPNANRPVAHTRGRVSTADPAQRIPEDPNPRGPNWAEAQLFDVTTAGGSSGGPIFDRRGRLRAIVVGGRGEYTIGVPSPTICRLLGVSTTD